MPDTAQIYPTNIVFIKSANCHHEAGFSFTVVLQVGKLRHKKQFVHLHRAVDMWTKAVLGSCVELLMVTLSYLLDRPKKSPVTYHEWMQA